ncbi:MAG: hypothetical protein DHS20C18_26330 [Saprospiraceae bacterium]|nr:MAG: hypothetical protein DHS20C18_26330 [Saprospiraceae bacterium]
MEFKDIQIPAKVVNKLSNLICDALYNESANILHMVCKGYGLSEGTSDEAFQSKRNYVNARIRHLSPIELYELAKNIEGKYPKSELDEFLSTFNLDDHLNLISKFENIRTAIIDEVIQAKYLVWVAVAWFTDENIANELYKQSRKGVNIQIIINDDEINKRLTNLDEYFEVYRAPKKEPFFNLMHHKFCIVDFNTVIHGSYNWTMKAQYNNETISIVENRETAYKFADEFIKIKRELLKHT